MAKPTINQCLVLVQRATSVSIPTTVFEYEVEVLRAIHGEQDVTVESTRAVPVPEGLNAVTAYAQLQRKYVDAKNQEAIKFVYRNVQALANASGLDYQRGDEETIRFEQATIVVHDEEPTAVTKVAKAA